VHRLALQSFGFRRTYCFIQDWDGDGLLVTDVSDSVRYSISSLRLTFQKPRILAHSFQIRLHSLSYFVCPKNQDNNNNNNNNTHDISTHFYFCFCRDPSTNQEIFSHMTHIFTISIYLDPCISYLDNTNTNTNAVVIVIVIVVVVVVALLSTDNERR
jgi:hypothetical protein